MEILCTFLSLYVLVLIGRAILSWFPIQQGSVWAQIFSVLYALTEPVLGPMRRAIPPAGGLDLSFIILIVGIEIVQAVVLGCTGGFL